MHLATNRASDLIGIVLLKVNEVDLKISFKVESNTERVTAFPIDLQVLQIWIFHLFIRIFVT